MTRRGTRLARVAVLVVALASTTPGRSPLHRLNRSEYAAAVRDILVKAA